jgi:hypothetical protein
MAQKSNSSKTQKMSNNKVTKASNNPNAANATDPIVGLGPKEWEEKLSQIAKNIKIPTKLTLMGSAPNMLRGQPSRMSIDLDVWKPTSSYDKNDLQQAVEKAGLLFNPTEEVPEKPYIQIVEPGICQLGRLDPNEIKTLEKMGNLDLQSPPIENLIASKLLRCEAKDLEDISWMFSKYQPDVQKIKNIIKTFPSEAKSRATENLVYLEVISQSVSINLTKAPKSVQPEL